MEQDQTFASSGTLLGPALAAVAGAVVLVVALSDGVQLGDGRLVAGVVLLGLLTWALWLRPKVSVRGDRLCLRGSFDDVAIPLAAIDRVAIGRFLLVVAGGRRYISTTQSRPRLLGSKPATSAGGGREVSEHDFIEQSLTAHVESARARLGIGQGSPEELALADGVVREVAWPIVAAIVVVGVGLLVSLFL